MNINKIAEQLNCKPQDVEKIVNNNNKEQILSKNKSETRLVNFRFRLTDVKALDNYAAKCNISRTKAVEDLINNHCLANHDIL